MRQPRTTARLAIALLVWGGLAALGEGVAKAQAQKLPQPVDTPLETRDGLQMRATYYPSAKGKEAVPVIALHGFKGSRVDYHNLALALQQEGYAVLAPDLRGHGGSTMFKNGEAINAARMPAKQFEKMGLEIDACKGFLMQEHNRQRLNIDKLCLIGADMSTILAINYAALDWSFPPLAGVRQGQDVKALVLLSPQWSFKTLNCGAALNTAPVQRAISMYFLVGEKDRGAVRDAERVYSVLERHRKNAQEETLFIRKVSTSLQGTKLLALRDVQVSPLVVAFFNARVASQSIPWQERKNPLAGN